MLNSIHKTFGAKNMNPMYMALVGLLLVIIGVSTLVLGPMYLLSGVAAGVMVAAGGLLILANPKSSWGTQH